MVARDERETTVNIGLREIAFTDSHSLCHGADATLTDSPQLEGSQRTTTLPLSMFMPHTKAMDRAGPAGTVTETG
jgi:hypothetical protein